MVKNISTNHVGLGNKLKSQFGTPIFNFQLSSITHFLSHKFQDPSCRICSYGPYGPFWFSVKNRPDMEKNVTTKKSLGEKSLFEIIRKMN